MSCCQEHSICVECITPNTNNLVYSRCEICNKHGMCEVKKISLIGEKE